MDVRERAPEDGGGLMAEEVEEIEQAEKAEHAEEM